MGMHNPPHPGEFIREIYIKPFKISSRKASGTIEAVVVNVSPEMALRLSKTLGRSPESWLAMQDQYDLWHAKKTVDLRGVKKLIISAA